MFANIFTIMMTFAHAEPTESTTSSELTEQELSSFYTSEKKEEPTIQVNLLSEEEDSLDFSNLSTSTTVNVEITVGDDAEPMDRVDEGMVETVAPSEQNAFQGNWSLDLSEDLEIGDRKLQITPKAKSEPVNLDFLEENTEE